MNESLDNRSRADGPSGTIEDRLERLERRVAELARLAKGGRAGDRQEDEAAERARAEEWAEAVAWRFDHLERRLARHEARTAALARQLAGHEEALKLVCDLLRQMDDPYGLGISLDDRLFGDDDPAHAGGHTEG